MTRGRGGPVGPRRPAVFILAAALAVALPGLVPALIRLPPGAVDVNSLMARSSLVCKGRVTRVVLDGEREEHTTTFQMFRVTIKADRCYKGPATGTEIVVAVADLLGPQTLNLTFHAGEYLLLFLKSVGDRYVLTDPSLGKMPASEGPVGPPPGDVTDSLQLLEADLKAALNDANREVVIVALRLLAGMRQLRSTKEFRDPLPTTDRRVEGLVYLALIKHGDYVLLGEAGRFVESETSDPTWSIHQILVAAAIGAIADSKPLPTLHEFTRSRSTALRLAAVRALRAIRSRESVVVLIPRLDDVSSDVRYGALMALATIDDSALERAPSWELFEQAEATFIQRLKDWWNKDGRKKYAGD